MEKDEVLVIEHKDIKVYYYRILKVYAFILSSNFQFAIPAENLDDMLLLLTNIAKEHNAKI